MYELIDSYTTQTQADVFVRTHNHYIHDGRIAVAYRVGPGQYQVWLTL